MLHVTGTCPLSNCIEISYRVITIYLSTPVLYKYQFGVCRRLDTYASTRQVLRMFEVNGTVYTAKHCIFIFYLKRCVCKLHKPISIGEF